MFSINKEKIFSFVSRHKVVLTLLFIGFVLRAYKPLELYMYSHDQDLAAWTIKDILVNGHIRLIGQETSSHGVFIGPLFYYLQIPFYLLTGMDPKGALLLPLILGLFGIFSYYFVFGKVFGKRVGLIASFIYAISTYIVFNDREIVPTMPTMLWVVWYFYSVCLLWKGNQKAWILVGFLLGLSWHLHLALLILAPISVFMFIFSRKNFDFKFAFIGFLSFILVMSPYIVFETRHEFQQTRAIVSSLTTSKDYVKGTSRGLPKMDRVLQLVHKNTTGLFLSNVLPIPLAWTFYGLCISFIFLVYKKLIPWHIAFSMILWQILYVGFFTLNSINTSEYYINGMNLVWIAIASLGINYLLNEEKLKKLGFFLIFMFALLNLYAFFTRPINKSGYLERKAIVNYINEDAKKHNFPCVSISYITSPGNNLGYRYFFWLKNMKIKAPITKSPVYTIVFPLSEVDRADVTFGALGLVLPDYERYTRQGIEKSCQGENENVTGPVFGFTN